jgi:pyridoxal 5'-phosphate synthase pdxT subunit
VSAPKVGVLALQGAFREHREALAALDVPAVEVRRPEHLAGIDALVMPGGESTTMSKLLDTADLREAIGARLADGLPVLGTCAGMILLARDVLDARPDQRSFGAIDLTVRRNGYGRQLDSFETDLDVGALAPGGPFPGVFIRAPVVESVGDDVAVLVRHDDRPVLVCQGAVVASSFHPELSGDLRIHEWFVRRVAG